VSVDPGDSVALAYSGWIALLAGSPDKALDRLARAEAAAPGYPDAHAFRGIALLRSGGDAEEARAELERYLQLAPDGGMAQQVRDVLRQLDGSR
jgi:tetratricopeptide (TPR) repeat protein